MQVAAAMSEPKTSKVHTQASNDEANLGGRPSLAAGEDTVQLTIKLPRSLRDKIRSTAGKGDTSAVVRALMSAYVDMPDEARQLLDTDDKVYKALMMMAHQLIAQSHNPL